MKKFLLVLIVFLLPSPVCADSTYLLNMGGGDETKIRISENVYPGDDFVTIAGYIGGSLKSVIDYYFLGVDNHNNLHVRFRKRLYIRGESTDAYRLIFGLNGKKVAKITLSEDQALKKRIGIPLEVRASNQGLSVRYLGSLPLEKK